MAGMARHGSVGAFSGFSVCQPALGAALQWLPAIGTAELDDMINAFLPGPASIQDKRAHISMDFFEFSRQTGENFKFYPVSSGSFTPLTASPTTSALYDSSYSPVLSDQDSWAQSSASFAPTASDARTKSRSSVPKKSSTASSRQGTVDFATHPGMRILTKDGRDVTNSASRGCKTKEQRDHAHLMRIIKACDSCRKKKVRCDPSHRKRNAPATSGSQAEQKPAKKPKKVAEPPPVALVDGTDEFFAGGAFDEATLSFQSADAGFFQDADELWNDFITFDQEPVAVATAPTFDDFLFDSFTDLQNYSPTSGSPTSGSSSTSPSQTFTPFTSIRSGASPVTASDLGFDTAGEFSQDPTVPYLNPGVAHGTNYVDFNLYSPGPEIVDEDPVLQLRDLASRQQSPHSLASVHDGVIQGSPRFSPIEQGVGVTVSRAASVRGSHGGERQTVTTSPVGISWYYDPGPSLDGLQSSELGSATNRRVSTRHNSWVEGETGAVRPPGDGRPTSGLRLPAGDGVNVASPPQSPVPWASLASCSGSPCGDAASTVVARAPESSVSPSPALRPRRPLSVPVRGLATSSVTSATLASSFRSGVLPPQAVATGLSTINGQPCNTASAAAPVEASFHAQRGVTGLTHCSWSPLPTTLTDKPAPSAPADGQSGPAPRHTVAVNAVLLSTTTPATTTTVSPASPPTRRNVAGGQKSDALPFWFFLQLAALGLVSLLCASAALGPAAHLARQVLRLVLVNIINIDNKNNNMLAVACISLLARPLASPSSSQWQRDARPPSKTLLPLPWWPATVAVAARVPVLRDLPCAVRRRVGNLLPSPRLLAVR